MDYVDILPPRPKDYRDVLNWKEFENGEYDKCVWQKQIPQNITPEFLEKETQIILRDGQWLYIKDEPIWLPPSYVFFLKYWNTGGKAPEFRLKMLMYVYHKIRCRKNLRCIGSVSIKNRQDGFTTIEMSDALYECLDGNIDYGQIGIQSKTLDTVIKSCWRTLRMGWQMIPQWFKDHFASDFVSGDRIAKTMKFIRPASDKDNGRDVLIAFGAAVHNAFDSLNNMRLCILDEFAKMELNNFYQTFLNYKNFIIPGAERKGMFSIFSSPSDTNGRHNDEAYQFWKESEYDEETKTSKSGVFRFYSDPLKGIDGFYDRWGDADPEELKAHIIRQRRDIPKEFLQSTIRAFPLTEFEMFGSFDNASVWNNKAGIAERTTFLTGLRFKNEQTKEPVAMYGNLIRIDGDPDGDVGFRMADKDHYDLHDARFCVHFIPSNKEPLLNIFRPPRYVESVLGVDPTNNRYEAKRIVSQSNGAMVCYQFRDMYETGRKKTIILTYCCRTGHQDVFFEDCLRAAIYTRSMVQYESRSDKLANYFEDRGYHDWLLPEFGAPANSLRKGDSPTGSGKFLDEGIGLIDEWTNTPLNEGDPYYLDNVWSRELLNDLLEFNPADTHRNDISMSLIQAMQGAIKLTKKKVRAPSSLNSGVMDYLFT